MESIRKIIHVDMDAFYASVEQRDRPELKGRPVVVGGDPERRGVVAACSYEARHFGIHSAMASARAKALCPHTIFLRPRFDVYKQVSRQINELFHEYTDLVEPLSLDEAFLDVTENKKEIPSATRIAMELKCRIYEETCLTASAGVSFNKFLAKVASDYQKPNGITVVTPEQAGTFVDRLPIGKFYGVGRVTEKKMRAIGIHTGADLKRFSKPELLTIFGKSGGYFYDIAHGLDNRPVRPTWTRKSLGKETTLAEDIDNIEEMLGIIASLADKVEQSAKAQQIKGRTLTLKVKYFDFQSVTRSITLPHPIDSAADMMSHAEPLLSNTQAGDKKVRLLGISISNLNNQLRYIQLPLPFDGDENE